MEFSSNFCTSLGKFNFLEEFGLTGGIPPQGGGVEGTSIFENFGEAWPTEGTPPPLSRESPVVCIPLFKGSPPGKGNWNLQELASRGGGYKEGFYSITWGAFWGA